MSKLGTEQIISFIIDIYGVQEDKLELLFSKLYNSDMYDSVAYQNNGVCGIEIGQMEYDCSHMQISIRITSNNSNDIVQQLFVDKTIIEVYGNTVGAQMHNAKL